MKKTQFIELLSTIWKTKVSFISISLFVALGMGFFLGLSWFGQGYEQGIRNEFEAYSLHNYDVSFAYGLSDQDIKDIAAIPGVTAVEGGYSASTAFAIGEERHAARVFSATNDVDKMRVLEGRTPQSANEAAVDSALAERNNLTVGDTVTFETVSTNPLTGEKLLKPGTYTVTAIITSPMFPSISSMTRGATDIDNRAADSYFIVPPSAFVADAYDNCYSNAYVLADVGQSKDLFAQTEASQEIENKIIELGKKNAQARYQSLRQEAQDRIDEAQAQVDEGEAQIENARTLIEENEQRINKGEQQLAVAWRELNATLEQLNERQAQLDEYQRHIGSIASPTESSASQEEYAQFLNMKAQLEQAWAQYYAAVDEYREQSKQLKAAKSQLEDGKNQLAEYEQQLADANNKLDDAKDQLNHLEEHDWLVSNRKYNLGITYNIGVKETTDNLRFSMALVFVLVGLLVCYSAMSRLIHEDAVNIGTKKALGFRPREITLSYMSYSLLAVLLGITLSIALAIIMQMLIADAMLAQVAISGIPVYFDAVELTVIACIELACIWLTTWIACRSMLKKNAMQLLNGSDTPLGKARFYERTALWNRLSLLSQSIVSNFFNEKARVVGTIMSIAGSTALVVIACMIYINIADAFPKHFEEVCLHNTRISYNQGEQGTKEEIQNVLSSYDTQSASVLRQSVGLKQSDGATRFSIIVVPENREQFSSVFHIISPSGEFGNLDDNGAWITQAFAEYENLGVGDNVTVIDSSGASHDVPIAGVFQYWIAGGELLMSPAFYEKTFGSSSVSNTMLARIDDSSKSQIEQDLMRISGVTQIEDVVKTGKELFDTAQTLTTLVAVIYFVLAAIMAFVVLTNLVVVCVNKKKAEVLTMRINGFSVRAAKAYVSLDSILLTIVGIALGLVLGTICGYFSILSFEGGSTRCIHDPSLLACAIGALVNAFLAAIITAIVLRRIPKYNLADGNA